VKSRGRQKEEWETDELGGRENWETRAWRGEPKGKREKGKKEKRKKKKEQKDKRHHISWATASGKVIHFGEHEGPRFPHDFCQPDFDRILDRESTFWERRLVRS
jgi:hypothetical protein